MKNNNSSKNEKNKMSGKNILQTNRFSESFKENMESKKRKWFDIKDMETKSKIIINKQKCTHKVEFRIET